MCSGPFPAAAVGAPQSLELMAEVYAASMTIVRNRGLIPLPATRPVTVIETRGQAASLAEDAARVSITLAQALAQISEPR